MNNLDTFQSLINRFNRELIGFDTFPFDAARFTSHTGATYPPYNVEKVNDTSYRITLAVAGFDEHNLAVTLEKNVLSIKGQKPDEDETVSWDEQKTENNKWVPGNTQTYKQKTYLHKGISDRSFERNFTLSEWIKVANTTLKNGLLTIDLVREIPEEAKPKKIEIKTL